MTLSDLNDIKDKLDKSDCNSYELKIEFFDKTKFELSKPKDEKDKKIGFIG